MMRSCAGKEQVASIAVYPTAGSGTVLACSADETSHISLSTLDSQGFRYRARHGILRVCKGKQTQMRGRLAYGLYFFQESAIARGATAVVFESCDHRVFTRSWHWRLGHESDAELQVLGRQDLREEHGDMSVWRMCG